LLRQFFSPSSDSEERPDSGCRGKGDATETEIDALRERFEQGSLTKDEKEETPFSGRRAPQFRGT
jgi:hypothetical protein